MGIKLGEKGVCRYYEVLDYLVKFETLNGRMPTTKEIEYDLSIMRGSLSRILIALAAQRKLTKLPNGVVPFKVVR